VGPIELWTKGTSAHLALPATARLVIAKQRWLCAFDTTGAFPTELPLDCEEKPCDHSPVPALGCHIELTQVTLPEEVVWWTFGFEAFGTLQTVANDLRAVVTTLAARQPPALTAGLVASYPTWLTTHLAAVVPVY
jgi:hypothetical protein